MTWLDCCMDVSHWNGDIDWTLVDPSIALVFVKATEGSSFVDPKFADNKAGVLESGRMMVPYHFFDASDVQAQIAHFHQFCTPGTPFMVDWEGHISRAGSAADVETFGTQLAAGLGDVPIVGYWGLPGDSPAAPTVVMATWTRLIPRWPVIDANSLTDIPVDRLNEIDAPFWQYTDQGRVAGFPTINVDRSAWNGTLDELRAWYYGAAKGAIA